MSVKWPPVEIVNTEKRHELVLSGKQLEELLEISGNVVDPALYKLTDLNYLKLASSKLESVDEEIGELTQMQSLVLHQNALSAVPASIGSMQCLKLLDLSGNKLTEIPEAIIQLPSLQILELSHNKLTGLSSLLGLENIHELILTGNLLEVLPEGLEECTHLHTIRADHNQLNELPLNIHEVALLKELNIRGNKLPILPPTLVVCTKLKILDVRDNPYSDRKLLKLSKVDQTSPKPIARFLQPLYDKMKSSGAVGKKKSSNPKGATSTALSSDEEDELVESLKIIHFHGEASSLVEIRYFPTVAEIRPHIVCCILRNIDFTQTPTLFKQFIALQTRLHEGICEKRLVATIATHDLSAIKSPLIYEAVNPKTTKLIPLGKQKAVTASDFMNKLQKEAEEARKAKKRNTVSGIHKYLDLLKDKSVYPFLKDCEESVISFPPITNCELTKIKDSTTDLLIEVTSSKSLSLCKQVVEQVILESHRLKISANKQLIVEQVKVTDPDGLLKTVYPSRADLAETPLTVIRE